MRELGNGVFESEPGDLDFEKLADHVKEIADGERARLTEVSGLAWYADAVFYVHDLISFSGLIRQTDNAQIADTMVETTTHVALALLTIVFNGDEAKAAETWKGILVDAATLDALLTQRMARDEGAPTH